MGVPHPTAPPVPPSFSPWRLLEVNGAQVRINLTEGLSEEGFLQASALEPNTTFIQYGALAY